MVTPLLDFIPGDPNPDDLGAIVAVLNVYNNAHSGMADLPGFAITIRDPETQAAVCGLYALDSYGWAFVRYLASAGEYRGLGRRLMEEAEKIAKARAVSLYRHMARHLRIPGAPLPREARLRAFRRSGGRAGRHPALFPQETLLRGRNRSCSNRWIEGSRSAGLLEHNLT
ncbi:hypothetical protein NKH58_30075 [Mesorhizobium australicum]|uniref:hypothetical protein n=1 Tax=Mesorhizobium australicum TaxID=536018 RepID=UPI0033367BF6